MTTLPMVCRYRFRPRVRPVVALLVGACACMLLPFFISPTNARSTASHRLLGPQSCSTFIYTSADDEPTLLTDRSSCPTGGGSRAFLLDSSAANGHAPKLVEVAPAKDQRFSCRKNKPCLLIATGFGLEAQDRIAILSDNGDCPPQDLSKAIVHSSDRHITTASAVMFDFELRPLNKLTVMPVFEIQALDEGAYTVCYAPKLASRNAKPLPQDFHYNAGSISIGETQFTCDFEQDRCGLMTYRDSMEMDLEWKRHSGATETEGTGPSHDHTYQNSPSIRGHYLYLDSPGFVPGATATVMAHPRIYPAGVYCVRMWYHMYGSDVNSLRVYMQNLPTDLLHDNPLIGTGDWGAPKLLRVGDHGDDWLEAGFDFTSDGKTPHQLVFEALAGFSEKGDIAIDDISAHQGRCPEDIKRDATKAEYICGEVRLNSGNWAEDKQWFIEGAVSCAGRGYSANNLKGSWVPCCVPNYGVYTVVLRDMYGDGWQGSKIEFRFFDQIHVFGEDFSKESGTEKKYKLDIGLVQIARVEGEEDRISMEVVVAIPDAYIWCGAAQVDAPAPTVSVLKKYGIRSQDKTNAKGDVVRMQIANQPNNTRVLQPNVDYSIYCYAESATTAVQGEDAVKMTDEEVAMSRALVTTDSTPPHLVVNRVEPKLNEVHVHFNIDERSTVWCAAFDATTEFTGILSVKKGNKIQVLKGQVDEEQLLVVRNLMPDTEYVVYCYAEDKAMPKQNFTNNVTVEATRQELKTQSKMPNLTIESYKAFARGFRVTVKTDTPSNVWCAAAIAGSAFPTRDDVKRVGATASIIDISKPSELEIRGVPNNTRYTIYCFASSRGGTLLMSDSDMWANALEVTSFGKFCDMPVEPADLADADGPTPFDPLTSLEEMQVREFMVKQRDRNIEGVYRITLYIDKAAITAYYEKVGPFPVRYARVRVGTCKDREGAYVQYKVGPISDVNSAQPKVMTIEQLGVAVPTDCGGYNPQGVFGRRLMELDHEEELGRILEESFGYGFGRKTCGFNDTEKKCLQFGPMVYEETDDTLELKHVWVGLKTPTGQNVPFYFLVKPPKDLEDFKNPANREEMYLHLQEVQNIWYNGQVFDSLENFIDQYSDSKPTGTSFEKFTPVHLDEERQRQEDHKEKQVNQRRVRRLASTNAIQGPNPEGRGGLEYRAAPEHIEPQGRRYTIRQSPDAESYTINYAGWDMVVNMDRDTGLRLWNVTFEGRRVVFEMGVMEALAHYSVAERNWYFIDSWYGGLGAAARRVHPGIECAKTGQVVFEGGSLCVFEQDKARPLRSHWKAGTLRDGAPHMALVLRQMITVSNYDYVTDYYFHLSGFFEGTVSFTGELYAGVEVPWYSARQRHHGTQVSGSMRMGALHAHLCVWKVDFDISPDYSKNSILYHEVVHDTARPGAVKLDSWIASNEMDGFMMLNSTRALHYTVINEDHNVYGNLGGFTLLPYPTLAVPNPKFELYTGPAAWAKYRIATTVRKDDEQEVTLPRDNKYALRPAVSLDRYLKDNENIRKADLVSWVSSAVWHIPVIEDMPLTLPIGNTLGWLVKPHNYFTEDMSMDLHNALGGAVQDPGTCAIIREEMPKYYSEDN